MTDLVPVSDTPERSLGPVVQQYRVLHGGGADHAPALVAAMQGAQP